MFEIKMTIEIPGLAGSAERAGPVPSASSPNSSAISTEGTTITSTMQALSTLISLPLPLPPP